MQPSITFPDYSRFEKHVTDVIDLFKETGDAQIKSNDFKLAARSYITAATLADMEKKYELTAYFYGRASIAYSTAQEHQLASDMMGMQRDTYVKMQKDVDVEVDVNGPLFSKYGSMGMADVDLGVSDAESMTFSEEPIASPEFIDFRVVPQKKKCCVVQ